MHGRRWKYDRLFEVAVALRADAVVNSGDMLPHVRDASAQGAFITDYLDGHFARFDEAGIHCLCILGNDDVRIFDPLFETICGKYPRVVNLAQRKVAVNGYEFVGMNWVVDYPFRLKDRCRMDTADYVLQEQFGPGLLSTPEGFREVEDWLSYVSSLPTLEDELDRLVRPETMARSVYVIHMPPCRLGLDECFHGVNVGSLAIYNFLRRHQPMLSLHGHIHESPEKSGRWHARLGDTVCVQPGQLDPFTYVTIDMETLELHRILEYER